MVKALDFRSRGRRFNSRQFHVHVTILGRLFTHTYASDIKQYKLILAEGRRRFATGKVTAGLAESNGWLQPAEFFDPLGYSLGTYMSEK